MEDKINKILKSLRFIQPDSEYRARSRAQILAVPKASKPWHSFITEILETFNFSAALVLAGVLLFVAIGGLSYFKITNVSPLALTGFDEQDLWRESQGLDFSIKLGEIKYFDDAAKELASIDKDISQLLDEIIL